MAATGTGEEGGAARGRPTLEELQHWTAVIGRAQQMMMEAGAQMMAAAAAAAPPPAPTAPAAPSPFRDPGGFMPAHAGLWSDTARLWSRFMLPGGEVPSAEAEAADRDRRFRAPEWRDNPLFDLIRQTYLMIADHLLAGVEAMPGLDPDQHHKLRFATRAFVDAMAPSNFALTNPQVLQKTIETGGANLLTGLQRMLADLTRGQITHTDGGAFELGRNIATTPGKVVRRTPLYELIHYQPTTGTVHEVPLVIFPPWINRFYILDLGPEKSFIRWALDQGLSVFLVSWRSADAELRDTHWDDYILRGQIDAIDTVRALLDVPAVHAIGYCVAGTTLAATLALLTARGEAGHVRSATFFTAQVDFQDAGDLRLFVDDAQLAMIEQLSAESGFLDGRYMAATFNLLRGRDLIWNYVVNNYLLGADYAPFDLLHWNGDVTNLPARWHLSYLQDLYRDNKLAKGEMVVDGTPIDLSTIETPAYVQAGREDHIAPPDSVWRTTLALGGPVRFVLAGSGHIAGVVNPPGANKYGYWVNDEPAESLAAFIAGAREESGSWWRDWIGWARPLSGAGVPVVGARQPGAGALPAIEDAPGLYVRTR